MENIESSNYDPINTPELKSNVYPNLNQSWGLFGMFIGASLFLGGIFSLINIFLSMFQALPNKDTPANFAPPPLDPWFTLIIFVGSFGITFFMAHLYSRGKGQRFTISRGQASWWVYLLLLPLTPALALIVDSISSLLPMPEYFEKLLASMVSLNLASLLTAVFAAAILEEVLCRGMILEGLLHHTSPRKAILWSALIFATLHLNPWQGIAAFTIGCVSGWVYWKTRSLGPSIFIHFVNNGLAFLLLYLIKDPSISAADYFGRNYPYVLLGSLLVVGICGYALYYLLEERTKSKD